VELSSGKNVGYAIEAIEDEQQHNIKTPPKIKIVS
jgi:hypothetical protein